MPPLSVMVDRPGVWPPISWLVATSQMPTIRKTTRAATLTRENQNSISPKYFTEIRFAVRTTARAMKARTHWGTSVNSDQKWA